MTSTLDNSTTATTTTKTKTTKTTEKEETTVEKKEEETTVGKEEKEKEKEKKVEPRCSNVFEYGLLVLNTSNSDDKARYTLEAVQFYKQKKIPMGDPSKVRLPPDISSRPTYVQTLPPNKMPHRRKAGTIQTRIALIHSFCHIESYAIDLSWDILVRFAANHGDFYRQLSLSKNSTSTTSTSNNNDNSSNNNSSSTNTSTNTNAVNNTDKNSLASPKNEWKRAMIKQIDELLSFVETKIDPKVIKKESNLTIERIQPLDREYQGNHNVELPLEFYEDWLRIAGEEAYHFSLWRDRLKELGSHYGALPAHDGLWRCALETRDDIMARLAIVHMVMEGRGLDVEPGCVDKLIKAKDDQSANMLKTISKDEITHVGSGVKWFKYLCEHQNPPIKDAVSAFQQTVRARFGKLKPPFNTKSRDAAGFTEDWYLALTEPPKQ